MELEKKRSSTRIRKPTAKMREDQNVSAMKSVAKKTINQVDLDFVANKGSSPSESKKTCAKQTYAATINQARTSFICKTKKIESEKKEGTENTIGKSADLLENESFGPDNFKDDISLRNDQSHAATNIGKEENILKDEIEDVFTSVKRQTVQVCVRLKDMILLPEKDCSEELNKRKNERESSIKSDAIVKRRKCVAVNESVNCDSHSSERDCRKKSLEGVNSDNASHENLELFKEDGSYVETYKGKEESNDLISSGLGNNFKYLNNGEIDAENSEESANDVDVLAEIEFEHLDMSDEELSDPCYDTRDSEGSLQCNKCSKSFSKKYYLTKHMVLHTDVKPFQCEICGMSFATKAYLTLHSVVHSRIRKYKCDVCDKAFLRRANLNTHKHTHSDVKAFSCDTCDKKFKTKSGRDFHIKEHDSKQLYQCHQCGKSFSQHSYLLKHISIHEGVKPYKCSVCEKSFPYNQSLQEHMRRHTGEKPETCDKCGKRFNNKRQLKSHMKYHNTVTQFSCEQCNMFYDSEQSLNKHITKTHNRKYDCHICSKSFVNKKHLRSHQNSEHKQHLAESRLIPAGSLAKVKKAVCSLCNSVFYNRYVLSKHLMAVHHLPEQDMKELLNIRKKESNKNNSVTKKTSDMNVKSVDKDKSFSVYYKDDEMAVYVKGTEDFETRLKAMTERNQTEDDGYEVEEGVQYIVLEDNEINNLNELNEVTYSNNSNEIFDLENSDIKREGLRPGSFNFNTAASSFVKETDKIVSTGPGDQSYFMVFTEANEISEKMVAEIQSEVVVKEEEIQNLTEDGTERIVLILNEGDDRRNFMIENGEQLQILSDDTEFLTADSDVVNNEYEVIATGPSTEDELNCQNTLIAQECNIVESISDSKSVEGKCKVKASGNLPVLEQIQTKDFVKDRTRITNLSDKINILESKDDSNKGLGDNATSKEDLVQFQTTADSKESKLTEEKLGEHTKETDNAQTMTSVVNKTRNSLEMETNEFQQILPKDNSIEEFTNFENALKSKSGDFQSQDEYNKFIDKMILTLQKAKH